ncbi:MAG TPA: diguanylate cyclase [Armatimonadota bacterium]|nr:diguanylate cyclase [Armatimonadota bacterium]
MRTSRLAAIGFAAFWLVMLTGFSRGSDSVTGLLVYAVLATLVGFQRSYLVRPGDGRSVVGVLACGASVHFGPIGGAIAGTVAALAHNVGLSKGTSRSKLLTRLASGMGAGWAAGFTYVHLGGADLHATPLAQGLLALPAALACFAIIAALGLVESRQFIYRSMLERIRANSPVSSEFFAGVSLVAAMSCFHALCPSEIAPLLIPIVYLAKQSMDDLLSTCRFNAPKDGQERTDLYQSMAHSLVAAIDARDRFTRLHTANVTRLTVSMACKMDIPATEIEGLRIAALLHDIGKLWVPEHILLKPGKLTPEQFDKIKNHPSLGQKILSRVSFPWPISEIIRSHHERWDGTGYPDRLKGEQIPLGARILCLADVYDAMTSKRSYRASNTIEQTIKYIRGATGSHFDPAAVQAFEQVMADGDLPGVDLDMIEGTDERPEGRPVRAQEESRTADAGSMDEDVLSMSSQFIAMFEIAQTANTSLDLEKMLYLLTSKIKSMISCSSCVILLRDEDSDQLAVKIALGVNAQYFEGGRTMIGHGQGLTGATAETGEGMIAQYDTSDVTLPSFLQPWVKAEDWVELQSAMVVPLIWGETVIGTINLYHANPNAFSDEDFHLLTAVAPQISKAVQNALLFKQTTESALTDVLTGLHNARYLFTRLEQELNRAKRLRRPVSVLGLDLDSFKAINDTFGHQQGDVALKEMAKLFLSQVRDYDLVCRYAGDEFVIVLPDTNKSEALDTARRIEAAVDAHKPYGHDDKKVRIGVSVGAATYPDDGHDVRTLIARADVNMYAQKKRRREDVAAA